MSSKHLDKLFRYLLDNDIFYLAIVKRLSISILELQLQLCECQSACPEAICDMYCEHGFQQDGNGCDICQCNICPQKKCQLLCAHGFKKGSDGCQVNQLLKHLQLLRAHCLFPDHVLFTLLKIHGCFFAIAAV